MNTLIVYDSAYGNPEGFIVNGVKKGPLKKCEAERAAEWAKTLIK